MRAYEENGNLILCGVRDFDLTQIFECGQCFRWDKDGDGWVGVAFGRALRLMQNGDTVTLFDTSLADWESIWRDYFDMDRDYGEIKTRLCFGDVMPEAVTFGHGIRLLRQEPFECLISFIISASNNIPRIKKIISALCENFGEEISYMGKVYYTFPSAERLGALTLDELGVIKAGFRDKYILAAARAVAEGRLDLECLKAASFDYAKAELLKLAGVGNKVCECVLLFSLEKYEGFPVDVWIKRIMEHCFFDGEQDKETISAFARESFGDLCGFAQQYLFYWARENKIGI